MTLGIILAGIGVAVAGSGDGSMTITRDGTVLDGRKIEGYVHIKADDVTIRNSTIKYGGAHAVRIFDGFTGALVENTRIQCTEARTNGIVFGNYTARKVRVIGCRNGFVHSPEAPATIVMSTWNGQPVAAGDLPSAGKPTPAPDPGTPTPGDSPDASDSAAAATVTRAPTSRAPSTFPGPDNTGVPASTALRASGSLKLTQDGQVVSGLNITGCVTVTAKNVVLRKSRITCGGNYSIRTIDAVNLVVEDVEINGLGKNSAAVCCGEYTLRRVDISNVIDGPRLGSDVVVEDSWIHHLTRGPGSHNDTLQTTGASNIVIRGNSLEAYNPVTKDPFNACLMIGSTTGPIVSNLLFEGNYCNGGNYSIGIRTDLNAANIRLSRNVFGRNHRYGVIARPDQAGIRWDRSTNLYADNRKPVVG
ncbi:hypothetical protein O7626_01965 [Micromonospora sp. WMMD1102]|uniref:hypothetical protein n=1 Tax=Micromonospora sp. WMMD1102 TaxID=3016105 RepID=UPI0024155BE5|nr:hypothetical protein [Micromonospora sp. WMMD1102]MDG4784707.1 hypothetical protein [Micromonospora sp. WMMD1102]